MWGIGWTMSENPPGGFLDVEVALEWKQPWVSQACLEVMVRNSWYLPV